MAPRGPLTIETPGWEIHTYSFNERYAHAHALVEDALRAGTPAQRQPTWNNLYDLSNYDMRPIMAQSLDSPQMPDTIALWERMVEEPRNRYLFAGTPNEAHTIRVSAFLSIGDPPFLPKLLEIHRQYEGQELGDRIARLFVAKAANRVDGYQQTEEFPFLERIIPQLVAKAGMEMTSEQQHYGPIDFPDSYKVCGMRLGDIVDAAANMVGSSGGSSTAFIDAMHAIWQRPGGETIVNLIFDKALAKRYTAAPLLEYWGMNAQELEAAWKVGYGQDTLPDDSPRPGSPSSEEYRLENVKLMRSLEYNSRGICERLRRHNLMRNFARHEEGVLIDMDAYRHECYEQNVLFLCAASDHNGATYAKRAANAVTYFKLRSAGIGVYFVEFASVAELEQLKKAWTDKRPGVQFQVVSPFAHGSSRRLESNRTGDMSPTITYIDISDIQAVIGGLLVGITSDEAVVPLNICSAGKEDDGVAGTLHKETGRHVIGGTEPASMTLTVNLNGNRISGVTATYSHRYDRGDNTWVSRDSKPNEYGKP